MKDSRLTMTHRAVLRAIAMRGGWCSTHSLGQLLPQFTGETAAKKARDLRRWGYLERRKVPDRRSGGSFVEYRIARGRPISTTQTPAEAQKPKPDAPGGGLLFDIPPTPRPLDLSCKGKAIRQPKEQ